MPSDRNTLHRKLALTERELKGIEAVALLLLVSLFAYAIGLLYVRNWEKLVGLLPAAAAVCAALLVAKTATRLLTYNMLTRSDDRAHEIVRVTHHAMAIINDLRGRVHYMKVSFADGNQPLVAITQNAEAIQKRYEALYDRELYRYLPGHIVDAIGALSGSVFGLVALAAGVTSAFGGSEHSIIPAGAMKDSLGITQTISGLESDLDALFSEFEKLRATAE